MEQLTNKGKVKRFLAFTLAFAMMFTSNESITAFASAMSENAIVEELSGAEIVTSQDGQENISENGISGNAVSQNTVSGAQVSEDSLSEDKAGSELFTLSVDRVDYNSVTLKWVDNNYSINHYEIYRRVSSLDGEEFTFVKNVKNTVKKIKNGGLAYDTNYEYYVKAVNRFGESFDSNTVSALTRVGGPLANKTKAIITKKNRVKLTWEAVTGAKRYKIERQKADGTWEDVTVTTLTQYVDWVDDSGAQTYIYRISGGKKSNGEFVFGKPTPVVCTPTVLVAASVQNWKTMGIQFTQTKGATTYVVQRSKGNAKNFVALPDVTGSAAQNTQMYMGNVVTTLNGKGVASIKITDNGKNREGNSEALEHGIYYNYRVQARAIVDGEEVKSKQSVVLKARATMGAPQLVSISSSSGSRVKLVWEDKSEVTGGNYYQIWRSTKPFGGYKKQKIVYVNDATKVTAADAGVSFNCLSAEMTRIPAEVTYYYRVSAVINGVPGTRSDFKSVRTQLNDLTELKVESANLRAINMTFKKVDGATQYNIYMATNIADSDGNLKPQPWSYTRVAKCTASANAAGYITYQKTGLTAGQYYAFKVRPATKNGEHVHQNGDELYGYDYTKPKAPKLGAASESVSSRKIKLTWTPVNDMEYYILEASDNEFFDSTSYSTTQEIHKGTSAYKNSTCYVSNLTIGKTYYFRIRGVKKVASIKGGEIKGAYSNVAEEWIRAAAPASISATGHIANEGAKVTWTAVPDPNSTADSDGKHIIFYRIERSMGDTDGDGKWDNWETLNPSDSKNNKSYSYDETTKKYTFKDTKVIADGTLMKYRVMGMYYNTAVYKQEILGRPAAVLFCNPKSIELSDTKIEIAVGATKKLSVKKFNPAQTTAKHITWASGNTSKVTVTSDGTIKGIATNGDNYCKVTAYADNGVSAVCYVRVVAPQAEGTGSLKICLDPGHGGDNHGASANGWREEVATLIIANACKDRLLNNYNGASVVMTRTSDTTVNNAYRADMAKNQGCNVLVSFHLNSGGGTGTEVLLSGNASDKKEGLASKILANNNGYFGLKNRGTVPRSDLAVLNRAATLGVPSILIEEFFIDVDTGFLNESKMREVGYANADAIASYYGLSKK